MATVKSPARVLQVALALGWSADLLFYGKSLGISVPLFALLLLASLFVLGRLEGTGLARRNLWLLLPVGFFATMVVVRANAWLTILNMLALFALLALMGYFYAGGHVARLGLLGYPLVLLMSLGHMVTRAGPEVTTIARASSRHKGQLQRAVPV